MNVTVDLSNCDREPIHLLGSIQPFGFLLGVSREWIIMHASENIGAWLGKSAREIVGTPLSDHFSVEAIHSIRSRLQLLSGPDSLERMFRAQLSAGGPLFDVALHSTPQAIFIEAEPSTPPGEFDPISLVRGMLTRVQSAKDFNKFCHEAARQLRALIGFDRVMVYRFDQDEAGEVVAESVRTDLVKFLGLHYPASDIPRQARLLYTRNLLRIISDIGATPVPILSEASSGDEPIDLSMSILRSVSPIHIEYLKNMGVGASLSVSILQQGKLWGLFACHHMSKKHVNYERRSAAELFGQMFALLLESRERAQESEIELQAQERQSTLVNLLAGQTFSISGLAEQLGAFSKVLPCDGVAVVLGKQISVEGQTPTREQIGELVHTLQMRGDLRVIATHALQKFDQSARDYVDTAAGMIAIPVSRTPRDYVLFFRKEFARTITWGGDPTKPAQLGPNGIRLTPRKSFEAWTETVRGQSRPWSRLDLKLAEELRITLLEVILRLAEDAAHERKTSNERQELLIAELNHRVRNILGLIRGLITQGRERAMTVEEFASVIGGRIQALARAHDQITIDNWGPASLRTLFTAETAAYLNAKADRVVLDGPDVLLDPRAFSTLALVAHELLTNSAKYGALADSAGRVNVRWGVGDEGQLRVEWKEEGGPPVRAPTRRGFGSTVIERSIPYDLHGEAKVEYELAGVKAEFTIPASFVTIARKAMPQVQAPHEAEAPPVKLSGRVLVVEDNMIIALDAEATLESLGATTVDVAPNVSEALRLVENYKPNFAVLDVNLGNESSFPVADRLVALGVPIVFATGYGKNVDFPERFAQIPVVSKPYSAESLVAKIAQAFASEADASQPVAG
ncbi:MAG TPA: HWE histidine kinase domain-containing protein [Rhizomicrobium sp.]|jgi:light-regulated signal transduction histidine kinase (bacteriophytochrome)/CheY-like chemotaxis protein